MRHPAAPQTRSLIEDLESASLGSFLDMARWVAAAMVFVAHLRNPLFLGYSDIPEGHRTLLVKGWYFLTGWHAEAVTVFFVLSGLLVGAVGLARARRGEFRAGSYAIDRVTRLYLAFLPALCIGYLLDRTGSSVFGAVGFWDHSHPMIAQKVGTAPFITMLDAHTFAANVLMLQDYYATPLGSNQPLWTISAEFWFYAVFLCAVGGFALARSKAARAAWLLPLACILLLLGTKFLSLLLLWGIGVAIVMVPPRRALPPLAAGLILLLVLVIARWQQAFFDIDADARYLKNLAVALAFAHLVASLRGRRYAWLERLAKPNAFMAGFSYSLYLLHFPLMLFLLGLLHATGWFPGIAHGYLPTEPAGLAAYAMTIVTVFVLVWLFSLFTERRTMAVRRFLKSRLPGLLPTALPPAR